MLNYERFKHFIATEPRNYSSIVMFTTLNPSRGCHICSEAYSEYKVIAESSRLKENEDKFFFFVADYDKSNQVFSEIGIDTAPVFIHFPAGRPRSSADIMDIQRFGFRGEVMSRWISQQSGNPFKFVRPPNYVGSLLLLTLVLLTGFLIYFKRASLMKFMNTNFWTFLSMTLIFYMISGQVWNHIRGPALIQANNRNELIFIYPGAEYQFVLETMIVMLVYIAITGGVILLQEMIKSNDILKRRIFGFTGLLLFGLFTSLLILVFRRKYPSYPYKLFL